MVANVFNHHLCIHPYWKLLPLVLLLGGCGLLPDSSEADAREAVALIQQNRVAEARLAIGEAISERDDVPEYFLIKGQIELAAGARDNAFVAFRNALDLDSTNRTALQQVAVLGLQVGRIREALDAIETILVLDPRNQEAIVMRGLIHLVQSDYDEALEFSQRLLRLNPNNEGGIILQARANLMLGNTDEAVAALAEFEEKQGVTIGSARNRIEIGRYLSDPDQMARGFPFLLRETPDDLSVRVDYANFLFKTGERTDAVKQLATAISQDPIAPADVDAILSIAKEYDAEEELAQSTLDRIATFPESTRVKLARLFIDAELFAAADAALDGLSTQDAKATAGWLRFRSGNSDSAEELAQSVLVDDEENCIALFVSAHVDLAAGRSRDAIRKGQRAGSQCPEEKEAWAVTGLAFAQNEDDPNAKRVFRDGIENLPQSTDMTAAYIDWLLADGAEREAIAAARRLTSNARAKLSGWELYENVCRQANSACASRARAGLNRAEEIYGVDLKPGERPTTDLLGRLERR